MIIFRLAAESRRPALFCTDKFSLIMQRAILGGAVFFSPFSAFSPPLCGGSRTVVQRFWEAFRAIEVASKKIYN